MTKETYRGPCKSGYACSHKNTRQPFVARCGKPGQEMVRAVAAAIAALTLVLLTMRLGGVIDWPWPWVLAPLWATGLVLIVGWLAFVFTFAAAMHQRDSADEAASKAAAQQDDSRQR